MRRTIFVKRRNTGRRLALLLVMGVILGQGVSAEPRAHVDARLQADLEVVKIFRPAYPFWQYIFTIPDGRIAFGSEQDGRLIATFPSKGNWGSDAVWEDAALAASLKDVAWPLRLDDRRELVARRLEPALGAVVSNPTRGLFLMRNVPRYGSFLNEWGLIY